MIGRAAPRPTAAAMRVLYAPEGKEGVRLRCARIALRRSLALPAVTGGHAAYRRMRSPTLSRKMSLRHLGERLDVCMRLSRRLRSHVRIRALTCEEWGWLGWGVCVCACALPVMPP